MASWMCGVLGLNSTKAIVFTRFDLITFLAVVTSMVVVLIFHLMCPVRE